MFPERQANSSSSNPLSGYRTRAKTDIPLSKYKPEYVPKLYSPETETNSLRTHDKLNTFISSIDGAVNDFKHTYGGKHDPNAHATKSIKEDGLPQQSSNHPLVTPSRSSTPPRYDQIVQPLPPPPTVPPRRSRAKTLDSFEITIYKSLDDVTIDTRLHSSCVEENALDILRSSIAAQDFGKTLESALHNHAQNKTVDICPTERRNTNPFADQMEKHAITPIHKTNDSDHNTCFGSTVNTPSKGDIQDESPSYLTPNSRNRPSPALKNVANRTPTPGRIPPPLPVRGQFRRTHSLPNCMHLPTTPEHKPQESAKCPDLCVVTKDHANQVASTNVGTGIGSVNAVVSTNPFIKDCAFEVVSPSIDTKDRANDVVSPNAETFTSDHSNLSCEIKVNRTVYSASSQSQHHLPHVPVSRASSHDISIVRPRPVSRRVRSERSRSVADINGLQLSGTVWETPWLINKPPAKQGVLRVASAGTTEIF